MSRVRTGTRRASEPEKASGAADFPSSIIGAWCARYFFGRFAPALVAVAVLLLVGSSWVEAATITKQNNNKNLNIKQGWIGNKTPGSGDIALWNSTVTSALASNLGASVSWLGIQITNVG